MSIINPLLIAIANVHNNPAMFLFEIIYTIIIFVTFILISIKIFKSNKLVRHKGIEYLTTGLTLFSLAYFIRIIYFSSRLFELPLPNRTISAIALMFIAYISSLAIIFIIQSNLWKKCNSQHIHSLGQLFAITCVIAIFLPRTYAFLIIALLQVILLSTLIWTNAHTNNTIYPFITIFWLLNMLSIFSRNLLAFEIKIVLQIVSLTILVFFYMKVTKWLK